MTKNFNPGSVAEPRGPYSHGVEVPPGTRVLYMSGQIGVKPDGSIGASFEEQAEQVWQNIVAILGEAGMQMSDVVKMTTFIVNADDYARLAPIRSKYLGECRPASTLLVVKALARPEFLLEIETVAVKSTAISAKHARTATRASRRAASRPVKRVPKKSKSR